MTARLPSPIQSAALQAAARVHAAHNRREWTDLSASRLRFDQLFWLAGSLTLTGPLPDPLNDALEDHVDAILSAIYPAEAVPPYEPTPDEMADLFRADNRLGWLVRVEALTPAGSLLAWFYHDDLFQLTQAAQAWAETQTGGGTA